MAAFLLTVGICFSVLAQDSTSGIPAWFLNDLAANVGVWTAQNGAHMSEAEPYDAYRLEWNWGIGETSIRGRMYGMKNGKKVAEFWQLHQYWDNSAQQAVVMNFGQGGTVGSGYLRPTGENETELIQTYTLADGRGWKVKHETQLTGNTFISQSFEQDPSGAWKLDRSYTFVKEQINAAEGNLGGFTLSLAVKDVAMAQAFYEKLGFIAMEGGGHGGSGTTSVQDWVLLSNGGIKIGLFRGVLLTNTITFNPSDARSIYKEVQQNNLEVDSSSGLENSEGPCSFSITDPDGNSILIEQH